MAADLNINGLLASAREGVERYLHDALARGLIDQQSFRDAGRATLPNLEEWLREDGWNKRALRFRPPKG